MSVTVFLRRISVSVSSVTMVVFGYTSMVSAQTITNTGPNSTNSITTTVTNNCKVTSTNNVSASSSNTQTATTGSADVSDNTTALPWTGWSALNPETAQASGQSYASWWGGVLDWVSARAAGQGWNDASNQIGWTAGSTQWDQFDPLAWQQQGKTFDDWFSSVQAFMNTNSATWLMTWPQSDTGSFGSEEGGATSGNATNVNNASFTVNIINRAPVDSCGHSTVPVVPPVTPGRGSGGGISMVSLVVPAAHIVGGSGGFGGSFFAPHFSAPVVQPQSAPVVEAVATPVVPSTPSVPVTPVTPPAPEDTISNTGPGSNNTITTTQTNNRQVTNSNVVSISNMNTQTASSGDATAADNTSAGGAGSGGASNGNSTSGALGAAN